MNWKEGRRKGKREKKNNWNDWGFLGVVVVDCLDEDDEGRRGARVGEEGEKKLEFLIWCFSWILVFSYCVVAVVVSVDEGEKKIWVWKCL